MKTYKTTARELFLEIAPAMIKLGEQRIKGVAAYDVARNLQIMKLAVEPIESVRTRINDDLASVDADEAAPTAEKLIRKKALVNEFDEILAKELELNYLPVPFADLQDAFGQCPVSVLAALMFMVVKEESPNNG